MQEILNKLAEELRRYSEKTADTKMVKCAQLAQVLIGLETLTKKLQAR